MKPAPLQRLVGDLRVVVRGPVAPSDDEFDAHVAEAVAMAGSVRAVLVMYSPGTRISPQQRARLVRAGLFDVPHAVLTDAFVARAEIEAVGGFGGPIRTFATHEFDAACEFLVVPPQIRPELVRQIALLESQLAADGAAVKRSPRTK
jgi:hypothetical protein